jgi:transposase InsO family protein
VKYAFIDQLRDSYPLWALCAALQVSDSGFATWQRGEGPTKWLSDAALLKHIREIHRQMRAAYGSPRINQELKARGVAASRTRVERLVRENDQRARHKRRFKATTDSKHSLPVAPNRLDQNLVSERPDQVRTADITYLATGEGWLCLAVVSICIPGRSSAGLCAGGSRRTWRSTRCAWPGSDVVRNWFSIRIAAASTAVTISEAAHRIRHARVDESQRQLLGQRAE